MTVIDPAERERKRRRHRNERIVAAILVLLVAGATAGVWWYDQKQREELRRDTRYLPKPFTITPEVTMLQELVRIDSSKPEGVAAVARAIAAHLEKNGIRAEIIESAPSMLNVYARIEGESTGGALLLFNHIDVMPAGEGWRRGKPFEGHIWGDLLVGRGTLDMKALTVCQLAAFVNIAKSGRKPAHDLVFLATAEEERGSFLGMQWLLAHRPDLFEGIEYGITEGGLTEMTGDQVTFFGIEIGGKQYVQTTLRAPTRDAIKQARIALEPQIFSRRPDRVLPAVRQHLIDLAPTRMMFREALSDIDKTIREGNFWRLPPTYRALMQNSIVTGPPVQEANGWSMAVTLLNLPDENPDARIATLTKLVAPLGVRVEVLAKEGPVPLSRYDTRLFQLLADEARKRYDTRAGVQVLFRSTSDSRFLRTRGIHAYGVSPYPVTFFQSVAIHHEDELISIPFFQQGVAYLRVVVTAWAKG